MLIEGGYILASAHVVSSFATARLSFPDGTEFSKTPVIHFDYMLDVEILGPIATAARPLALENGEALSIGSSAYLIGHDGQPGDPARATLTHGIISSFAEWDATGVTLIQTHAANNSGHKGGALVAENGCLIGFSGLSPSSHSLPLVTSIVDLMPIIQALTSGDAVSTLGDRRVRPEDGVREHSGMLANVADKQGYAVLAPSGETVEIEVNGDKNLYMTLWGYFGGYIDQVNDTRTGAESLTCTVGPEGSYLLLVEQHSVTSGEFTLTSSHNVIPLIDFDDGKEIAAGETILVNLRQPRRA